MFESAMTAAEWNPRTFSAYDDGLETCGFNVDMGFHETIPDIFQTNLSNEFVGMPGDFHSFQTKEAEGFLSLAVSSPGDSGIDLCELAPHHANSVSPFQDCSSSGVSSGSSNVSSSSSSPVQFATWQHPGDSSAVGVNCVNYPVNGVNAFQTTNFHDGKPPMNEHMNGKHHMMQSVPQYFCISQMPTTLTGTKPKRRRVQNARQRKAANVRERKRMFSLNEAFDSLKLRVPTFSYEKRLSRIETLRLAITYISFMSDVVEGKKPNEINLKSLSDSCSGSNSSDDSFNLDFQILQKSIESTLTSDDLESSDSCSSTSS